MCLTATANANKVIGTGYKELRFIDWAMNILIVQAPRF